MKNLEGYLNDKDYGSYLKQREKLRAQKNKQVDEILKKVLREPEETYEQRLKDSIEHLDWVSMKNDLIGENGYVLMDRLRKDLI